MSGGEERSRSTAPPPPAAAPVAPLVETALFRLRQWGRLFSAYFGAQSLAQLLGIGAGILFVNFLPVEEFALYTLALSVVSFFTFVTDLGSTGSLVYFKRRAAEQGEDFAGYVAALLSLRKTAFVLGLLVVLPLFPWIARREGFGAGEALAVGAALVVAVWTQVLSAIRLLVLRLDHRLNRSYRAELVGGALRLALAGLLVFAAWLEAWAAVASAAVATAAVAWVARSPQAAPAVRGPEVAERRRRIVRYLLPTLPAALYYSVQGPLVVWLAAAFGGTRNIAEVGALGRLGLVIGVFSGLTGILFLPRLAQVTDERIYRRRYLQYGLFLTVIGGALLAAAAVAPRAFLFVLGPSYRGLDHELLLVVGGAALTLVGGYAVGINNARSWNRWQTAAVGTLIASQALLAWLLPLGTTAGVLWFGLGTAAVGAALQLGFNAVGFLRPAWVHWS